MDSTEWRNLDSRPKGITIIAIISIIIGVFTLFLVILIIFGSLNSLRIANLEGTPADIQDAKERLDTNIGGLLIAIPLAAGFLFNSYGLLKGKTWSWWLSVMLYVVAIPIFLAISFATSPSAPDPILAVFGAVTVAVPAIAVGVIILIYMLRPTVKGYYGKA